MTHTPPVSAATSAFSCTHGLNKLSLRLNAGLELFFYRLSWKIADYPRYVIAATLILTLVGLGGFVNNFVLVSDPEAMFTPAGSLVIKDAAWSEDFDWVFIPGVPPEGVQYNPPFLDSSMNPATPSPTPTTHHVSPIEPPRHPPIPPPLLRRASSSSAFKTAEVFPGRSLSGLLSPLRNDLFHTFGLEGNGFVPHSPVLSPYGSAASDSILGKNDSRLLSSNPAHDVGEYETLYYFFVRPDNNCPNFLPQHGGPTQNPAPCYSADWSLFRSVLELKASLDARSSELSLFYYPDLSTGIGLCWDWSLDSFDADPHKHETLRSCLNKNKVLEYTALAGVTRSSEAGGAYETVTGLAMCYAVKPLPLPEHTPVENLIKMDEVAFNFNSQELQVTALCWKVMDFQIFAALEHDIPYLAIPFVILLLYMTFVFHRPTKFTHLAVSASQMKRGSYIRSHKCLAPAAILNVFLAILTAIGFSLMSGSPFTALIVIAVFITFGIGVDDGFIIAAAVEDSGLERGYFLTGRDQASGATIQEVVSEGLRACGPSLLLTSLTDLLAFLSNYNSPIMSIRSFSIVASWMVAIDFLYQVTFFVACVVLDMRRREAGGAFLPTIAGFLPSKRDIDKGTRIIEMGMNDPGGLAKEAKDKAKAVAKKAAKKAAAVVKQGLEPKLEKIGRKKGGGYATVIGDREEDDDDEFEEGGTSAGIEEFISEYLEPADPEPDATVEKSMTRHIMSEIVPRVVLHPVGKTAVMCLTAVLFILGCNGMSQLELLWSPFVLVPADSYLHEGRKVMHENFANMWELDTACLLLNGGDYAHNQAQLEELERVACSASYEGMCVSWYSSMKLFATIKYMDNLEEVFGTDGYIKPELFYDVLNDAATDETFYEAITSLVRWHTRDEIARSKICFQWHRMFNSPKEIEFMKKLRKDTSAAGPEFTPAAYSRYFFTIEPLSTTLASTLQNFVLIVLVVSAITLIVLADFKISFLVVAAVVIIEVILVGALPYYGLQFNMMTSINLIIGIGLSVDFSAHVGHAFLHSKSVGGHRKVVDAYRKVGLSVWNGAFSTFLALAPMVWCKSYIALLFWKMTTTVIVLGIYFGLCVLPVILSCEGGDTYEDVFPPAKPKPKAGARVKTASTAPPPNYTAEPKMQGIGGGLWLTPAHGAGEAQAVANFSRAVLESQSSQSQHKYGEGGEGGGGGIELSEIKSGTFSLE